MTGLFRQISALTWLVILHWRRSALVAGRSASNSVGRGAGLLLRLLFVAYMIRASASLGTGIHALPHDDRPGALMLSLWGVLAMAISAGSLALAPSFRGRPTPLRSPLLLILPVHFAARLFLSLAEFIIVLVALVGYFTQAVPSRPGAACGVAIALFGAGFLWGVVALRYAIARLSPLFVARAAQLAGILLLLVGYGCVATAPLLHPSLDGLWGRGPLATAARALGHRSHSVLPSLIALAASAAGAILVLWLLQRQGIEELDAAPMKAARNDGRPMTLAGTERLLSWREYGIRMLMFGVAVPTLLLSWFLFYAFYLHPKISEQIPPGILERVVGFLVVHMGATIVLARAARAADRDSRARPMLAALPLEPADTLNGKVTALEPFALAPLLAYLPLLVFVPSVSVAWRIAASGLGLILLSRAAPAVAFLTNGLGAPSAKSLGTSANLASLLLRFPLILVALTDSPFAAALALATLGAVSFEARRAGALCVRWLDDSADALARETPVWPALLVLAAFFALQAATLQFSSALFPGLPLNLQLPLGYAISGLALILMTFVGRRGLPPLQFFPARAAWLVAGALVGVASGTLVLGYGLLMQRFGVNASEPGFGETPNLAFACMAIFAAPLAEETFFRGWLQVAIGIELPARWRAGAFAIAAFAFAAVHPAPAFPVVFVFGLGAGWLFRRSGALLPGMIAHATHNAMAIFMAAS